MTCRHLIRRAFIATIATAALATSTASAMPARDGCPATAKLHHTVLLPGRVDADAHAATIRAIGARLLAQ
jgi:hypothetical protein